MYIISRWDTGRHLFSIIRIGPWELDNFEQMKPFYSYLTVCSLQECMQIGKKNTFGRSAAIEDIPYVGTLGYKCYVLTNKSDYFLPQGASPCVNRGQ